MATTSERLHYVEVPAASVLTYKRKAAEAMAAFCARDLGMPVPRVRWLVRADPEEARQAEQAGNRVMRQAVAIGGVVKVKEGHDVFLEVNADAFIVAHECRHAWQKLEFKRIFTASNVALLEQDANRYALSAVSRWPGTGE